MYSKFEALLEKHDIKSGAVAKATGIDRGTFTHWKKGDYTPKAETLQKIADYFGVPLSYFYGEESKENILSAAEQKLLALFNEMNEEGKELLLQRASELITLGYIKNSKSKVVQGA